ncbi:hypothetical protein [Allopontixanthobacter sp.]|uniref:hypothetical protein n=1 Tax=Allopontixanthobacter sp. TaxID=2906452 RepID=UPI002AB7F59D|nr:hypothetical protein [Allopontixanthobacter sp.]MDZ4308413.1 hypothetical protein [Allopontixanthobacter sp.]
MHETDLQEWDRLPSGEIESELLGGFEVAAGPNWVLLRLELALEDGRTGTAQLRMPIPQAHLLAAALEFRAGEAGSTAPHGTA